MNKILIIKKDILGGCDTQKKTKKKTNFMLLQALFFQSQCVRKNAFLASVHHVIKGEVAITVESTWQKIFTA